MLCSETHKDIKAFIASLSLPQQFQFTYKDVGDHIMFIMWEDNFKSLSGEQQMSVSSKLIDLMKFTIANAIPANLKVVRINE